MKKMSNQTKKWLTVAGCLGACAVLAVLIGNQVQKKPLKDEPIPAESSVQSDITVELPGAEKESVIAQQETTTQKETTAQQPDESLPPPESLPPQTDLPEQKIQPDVKKPEPPEPPKAEDRKDRAPVTEESHTFTPESPETPPAYAPEETERKQEESGPKGGDTQDGKIYVPGFGWIDEIGEGQGSTAYDMYENGNKIGVMD